MLGKKNKKNGKTKKILVYEIQKVNKDPQRRNRKSRRLFSVVKRTNNN